MSEGQRRLAAIMFTDIVGYTRLTQKNEPDTVRLLEEHRNLVRPLFAGHGGREIKTIGDAFLVEFQSALDAVLCAVVIQHVMHDRKVARGDAFSLRIGIHIGDVIESGNDILGDAVNIASRIEPLAEAGGICISDDVYKQVRNKSDLPFISLGEKSLKNVNGPVQVYSVQMPWERLASGEAVAFPPDRIAILPFTSFSSDPDDAYFADGVTDEIISAVAGISGLSVISRTSVVGYKGTAKKVEEIGRELKVGSILEGTFKKAGNKIRVTTQLIDVAQDKHLWAQNYDRNMDDVFAVQSDVAKQVAEALRVRILSPERERIEKRPTESTAAYTLYLKGRFLWNKRGVDDIRKAAECFEQAVKEDPGFALGFAGLADCCLILRANWGLNNEANLEKAKFMVARALELDPDLAEAHATDGLLLFGEYDSRRAEEEFKKAIELKPSYAFAHMWYYQVLSCQLRWGQALEQIEKAVELDPLSPVITSNLGDFYIAKKDYGKALDLYKRVVALDPTFASGHWSLAGIYGRMKMYDDMRREFAISVELFQGTYPLVRLTADATIVLLEGDRQAGKKILVEIEAALARGADPFSEAGVNAFGIAGFCFFLGEIDKGFEWLERSYSRKEGSLWGIKADPGLDSVRTDQRYLDLLKKIGLE